MENTVRPERPSFWGMVTSPWEQVKRIKENPVFWGPFFLVTILGAFLMGLQMYYIFQNPELVKQMMGSQAQAGFSPEMAAGMKGIMVGIMSVVFLVAIPVGMLIGALILWILVMLFQGEASFRQMFALQVHLMVYSLLGWVVSLVAVAAFGLSPVPPVTSLGAVVEAEGMLGGVLSSLELFVIWGTVVLAGGLQAIAGLSKGKAWTIAALMFVFSMLMSGVSQMFSA